MEDIKQIKILIADDHPLFLKGLRELIDGEPDWCVVAEAQDGEQAIQLIKEKSPDIAIIDINMPRKDGLEVAKYVYENQMATAIIILTMYDDGLLFNRAASWGVKGFILKESAVDDIVEGITSVAQGETYVSPKLTVCILDESADNYRLKDNFRFKLTRMEQKIIRLISENNTTKSIAEKCSISPKTVENHRSNICKKLRLSGKNALLRYVLENKEMLQRTLLDDGHPDR